MVHNWWNRQQSNEKEDENSNNFAVSRKNSLENGLRPQPLHNGGSAHHCPHENHSAASTASEAVASNNSSQWPQFSRVRSSMRSPTLPDEELNSMLQNYLDEKYSNKMDTYDNYRYVISVI